MWQLEQGLVVSSHQGIISLNQQWLLLPVLPEKHLFFHGRDQAPEEAVWTLKTQDWRTSCVQLGPFTLCLCFLGHVSNLPSFLGHLPVREERPRTISQKHDLNSSQAQGSSSCFTQWNSKAHQEQLWLQGLTDCSNQAPNPLSQTTANSKGLCWEPLLTGAHTPQPRICDETQRILTRMQEPTHTKNLWASGLLEQGLQIIFFYINSILRDLVATCRGRWREGAGSETCIFITLPSTVTVYKRENIVRPFCWCYVITKSTSLKLVKFTRLKIKMPRFCFDFCQAVKLCGLCRIKIILSYKYRHLTWKLKVIYFVFPGTQSVVYNYARIKKLIPKRFSCQVLRKVEAQTELTVGLNHVQTDLPRVCSSISSPRAAVEACPGSWAKHPEDEPAPSPAAAQPKVTLGTSERMRSQSTRS